MTTAESFLARFRTNFNRIFIPNAMITEYHPKGRGMVSSGPWMKVKIGTKTVTFDDCGQAVEVVEEEDKPTEK